MIFQKIMFFRLTKTHVFRKKISFALIDTEQNILLTLDEGSKAWCPEQKRENEWILVDLGVQSEIAAIMTQECSVTSNNFIGVAHHL